jgi:hypothetical protein
MSIVPLSQGVNFPMFSQFLNDKNEFIPNETSHKAAETMLREIVRWTKGLKIIKENKAE